MRYCLPIGQFVTQKLNHASSVQLRRSIRAYRRIFTSLLRYAHVYSGRVKRRCRRRRRNIKAGRVNYRRGCSRDEFLRLGVDRCCLTIVVVVVFVSLLLMRRFLPGVHSCSSSSRSFPTSFQRRVVIRRRSKVSGRRSSVSRRSSPGRLKHRHKNVPEKKLKTLQMYKNVSEKKHLPKR